MSVKALQHTIHHTYGNQTRKLIMIAIADHANDEGEAWPSIDTLAARAECSRRSVQEHLSTLEREGELAIVKNAGPRGCNLYRIVFKKPGTSGNASARGAESARGGADQRRPNRTEGVQISDAHLHPNLQESSENRQEPSPLPPLQGGESAGASDADIVRKITTLRRAWGGGTVLDSRLARRFRRNRAVFATWTADDWTTVGNFLAARLPEGDASTQPRELWLFLDSPVATLGHAKHWQQKQRGKTPAPALKVLPPPDDPPLSPEEMKTLLKISNQ